MLLEKRVLTGMVRSAGRSDLGGELKMCSSPGVISVIKGRIMGWVGHVAKR